MLKAIQILSCSSGLTIISQRLTKKTRNSSSSISLKLSTFSTSPRRILSLNPTRMSSSLPGSDSLPKSPAFVSGDVRKIKFCQWCGGPTKHEIPDGEEKLRAICTHCGKIAYQSPKMVVGCLIEHEGKVLLCKRNIQPSHGLCTQDSTCWLSRGWRVSCRRSNEGDLGRSWSYCGSYFTFCSTRYSSHWPNVCYLLGKMKNLDFAPGPESIECRLFGLDEIPFDSLAFSSIYVTLNLYLEDVKKGKVKFHYGTINKRPGSSPSDIRAFTLDYHLQP